MVREGDFCSEQGDRSLILPIQLAQQVVSTLEAALPFESGGLLFGRCHVGECVGEKFYYLASMEPNEQLYCADPSALVSALLQARQQHLTLLATIHSHPQGAAVPSFKDLSEAYGYQGMYHGIVSYLDARPDMRFFAYQKINQEYRYQRIPLIML